jgi:hypothetical protein
MTVDSWEYRLLNRLERSSIDEIKREVGSNWRNSIRRAVEQDEKLRDLEIHEPAAAMVDTAKEILFGRKINGRTTQQIYDEQKMRHLIGTVYLLLLQNDTNSALDELGNAGLKLTLKNGKPFVE